MANDLTAAALFTMIYQDCIYVCREGGHVSECVITGGWAVQQVTPLLFMLCYGSSLTSPTPTHNSHTYLALVHFTVNSSELKLTARSFIPILLVSFQFTLSYMSLSHDVIWFSRAFRINELKTEVTNRLAMLEKRVECEWHISFWMECP